MKAVEITVTLTLGYQTKGSVYFRRTKQNLKEEVEKTRKSILEDLEQEICEDGLDLQADGKLNTEEDRWKYENKQMAKWEKAKPNFSTKEVELKTDGDRILLQSKGSGMGVWISQEQFI